MHSLAAIPRSSAKRRSCAFAHSRRLKLRADSGSVALIGLIVMVTMITIALGSLIYVNASYQSTITTGQQFQALNLAEAGIDHAMWRLSNSSSWNQPRDEQDITFGSGSYYLVDSGGQLEHDSQGHVKSLRVQGWIPNRTDPDAVEAEIYTTLKYKSSTNYFSMAVLVKNSMTLAGSLYTYSYNSATDPNHTSLLTNGDIGTLNPANNNINIGGNPYIHGDILYPTGYSGAVKTPGSWWHQYNSISPFGSPPTTPDVSAPAGAIEVNAAVDGPVAYRDLYNNAYSGPGGINYIVFQKTDGTYIGNSRSSLPYIPTSSCLYSDGLPIIPAGTYHVHASSGYSMKATNNRVFRFGPGQTTLYIDGNLDLENSAMIFCVDKKPTNVQIFAGSGCTSITMSGDTPLYGGLYAPYASVTLGGSCMIYGSLVANNADLSGGGAVYYDEALSNSASGSTNSYTVSTWVKTR
jgi:hypothetical protein